jgi:hypothetical protein
MRQRNAFSAHLPMSIPHTYGLRAMGRSEGPSQGGPAAPVALPK